jgi:hypothetical protein
VGGEQSSLIITGEDLTVVMNQVDLTGIPYPAMPPSTRVLTIIARYAIYGMIPLVIPELFFDVPIPTDRIPTQRGTDLQYVEEMAREVGYVFYIEPGPAPGTNTAYWGPEIKLGVPQPALNTDMDAHTNVETLNFQFDAQKRTLPVVFIHNELTKLPIPIPIPEIDILNPPLGLVSGIPTRIKPIRNTAHLSPIRAAGMGAAEALEERGCRTRLGKPGRAALRAHPEGARPGGCAWGQLPIQRAVLCPIGDQPVKEGRVQTGI